MAETMPALVGGPLFADLLGADAAVGKIVLEMR
jgi:hypothetical protein